jgi:hypothetical protein
MIGTLKSMRVSTFVRSAVVAAALLAFGAAEAADTIRIAVQKTDTVAWEIAALKALGLDKAADLKRRPSLPRPTPARSRSRVDVGGARALARRQAPVHALFERARRGDDADGLADPYAGRPRLPLARRRRRTARHRAGCSHAVWLYVRFTLSCRDLEDLLAERGLDVSYETARRWVLKFGPLFAREHRRRRPRPASGRHLDEIAMMIAGTQFWLWRSVERRRRNSRSTTRPQTSAVMTVATKMPVPAASGWNTQTAP